MKLIYVLLVAGLVLQACGSSSGGGNGAGGGENNPKPVPVPGPVQPPDKGGQQSADFFATIDSAVAADVKGDKFTADRFYVTMARLSVYSLICDPKNQYGWSNAVSKLWNSSLSLQKLGEKVYGGDIPAYNRFEKQRNIESKRLSFESAPNVCELSKATFLKWSASSASDLEIMIRTTPRGSL